MESRARHPFPPKGQPRERRPRPLSRLALRTRPQTPRFPQLQPSPPLLSEYALNSICCQAHWIGRRNPAGEILVHCTFENRLSPSARARTIWWTHQDLNLGPLACEASALTGLSYASTGNRIITPSLLARKSIASTMALKTA